MLKFLIRSVVALALVAFPCSAQIINNAVISAGGSPYTVQNASKSYSLTTPSAGTLRFEVNTGDTWAPIDPSTKNRSEIAGNTTYAVGTPIVVNETMTIEPGTANTAPWLVTGQFHHTDNLNYSPPFEINFNGNERMGVSVNYLVNGAQAYKQLWTDSANIVRGHPYQMQIQATFDQGQGSGKLVVTRDGVTVVNYAGPMGFPGMTSVYWKEGIYRAASSFDMAIDYANTTVAKAQVQGPLKWAPPTLTNPTTITVTAGNFYQNVPMTQDYIVNCPSTKHSGYIWINGGHNGRLIGCWTTLPVISDTSNNPPQRGVYISNATGTVHLEGLLIDASGGGMSDGIDISAPLATVQIENVRIDGIFGYLDQFHADCIQPFGGVKHLRIDHLTCNTGYQGLSLWPVSGTPSGATVEVYNADLTSIGAQITGAHSSGGYLYWPCILVSPPATCANVPLTTLSNVYLTPRSANTFASTVFSTDSSQMTPAAALSGSSISFPGLPIDGHVSQGPVTNYVPAGIAGAAYVSPGYIPTSSVTTLNSAYVGNELSDLATFESWLGKKIDAVQLHGGRAGRADYTGSWSWLLASPQLGVQSGRIPIITFPMFVAPGDEEAGTVGALSQASRQAQDTLSAVAAGAYDSLWTANLNAIKTAYPAGTIYVRIGEEMNGNWMPWAATPSTASQFIAAFRRLHDLIKSVLGSRAQVVWCPNMDQAGAAWHQDTSALYPGDGYADVVSMDVYYNTSGNYQSTDPITAWDTILSAPYGPAWLESFASAHAKPTAFDEWGLDHDSPTFIHLMNLWMANNPPLYQGIWNQPATAFSLYQYSQTAAAYIADFGLAHASSAPTSAADSYAVNAGATLAVDSAHGVLSNDTDNNSLPLSATLSSNVAHGTLTLNADGSFNYVPILGYAGSDGFSYVASDSLSIGSPTTVALTVTARSPSSAPESYPVAAGSSISISALKGVLANDVDLNGLPLSATKVSGPSHGTLSLSSDGSFTYTPTLAYAGSDAFAYTASDSLSTSASTTVSLNVSASPIIVHPEAYSVWENASLSVGSSQGVLANDLDANALPLNATLSSGPAHGTLSLNADGSFAYTPTAGYYGSDSFAYVAADGLTSSSPQSVSLTVAPLEPVAVNRNYLVRHLSNFGAGTGTGLLAGVTDPNGLSMTVVIVSQTAHGTLSLHAGGSFSYFPANNAPVLDSFSYKITDANGSSPIATVTLTPVSAVPASTSLTPSPSLSGSTTRSSLKASIP